MLLGTVVEVLELTLSQKPHLDDVNTDVVYSILIDPLFRSGFFLVTNRYNIIYS